LTGELIYLIRIKNNFSKNFYEKKTEVSILLHWTILCKSRSGSPKPHLHSDGIYIQQVYYFTETCVF